jgi:hypothetical protein
MQFAATMPTAQEPGEKRLAAPHRSLDRGAAFAGCVVGNHALVPLELVPGDIARVVILEQNIPFGQGAAHTASHALAAVLDTHPARRAPESIGAGIDRVGQNVVHGVVGRQSPGDAARLGTVRFNGQGDALVAQPDMDLTSTLELGELGEDEPQCVLDPLVRVLLNPVSARLHIAGRNAQEQRATTRFLLQRLM